MSEGLATAATPVDLSIIIVNWNSAKFLRACVASILGATTGLDFEIIVIDAASFDGSDALLRENFPQVRFIQSDKNLGFARANNAAFKLARGRSLLFLNPDTELAGPAINLMHERLQSLPRAGAIGCRLLNSDRTLQTSCVQSFPTILNQFLDADCLRAGWPNSRLWGTAALHAPATGPAEVEAISGAAVMLKRSTFEEVGGFSEDYFMYAEDIDLSFKVRRAGHRNYYLPQATIIHHGGGSSEQAPGNFAVVMTRESIWRFLRKSRGPAYGLGYRGAMLVSAVCRVTLLGLLLPAQQLRRQHHRTRGALRKWLAVLRWSLMRESWVKQY